MAKKKAASGASREEARERHRASARERSRKLYADGADIGEIPACKNLLTKDKWRNSLFDFLVEAFPDSTGLKPFGEDHRKVIDRIQWSILEGQDVWNCVFRGFAKTSIAIGAAIWALLFGHRKFIVLIAANKKFAINLLKMVKTALETNEILLKYFPEVCFPIRKLGGSVNKCNTQTTGGKRTQMQWGAEEIRLPTVEGSAASAGICVATGISAAINGYVRMLPNGKNVRPDWWLADDLQTRETARNPEQVAKRLDALQHSVMMLGGHLESIGGCVNGTLFKPDDLMQQLGNPDLFPSFSGEVVPMVKQWPDLHEEFWLTEYARVLKAFDPKLPGDRKRAANEATLLYKSRRKKKGQPGDPDAGAVVTWEHAYKAKHGEISALQHAYNILILQGEEVFSTECQQQVYVEPGTSEQLVTTDIVLKLSGLKHREVPPNAARIVLYVDVQDESLWYVVIAWTADFTGYVIDYGEWPDQRTRDASKKKLKTSLSKKYKELRNKELRWRQGLNDLCEHLLGDPKSDDGEPKAGKWKDVEGREHAITFGFVDCADGDASIPIRSWIRTCKWNKILWPSMGLGLGPGDTPLSERDKTKDQLRSGLNWVEKRDKKVAGGSIVFIDTNRWKTFTANRWRAGSPRPKDDPGYRPNEPGALYLWGTDPHMHETFGTHSCAEWADRQVHKKTGREIDIWELRVQKPDNERWDCTVGCCVLADFAGGVSLKDSGLKSTPRPRRRGTREAEYF